MMMIRGDRRSVNGTEYGLRLWENNDLVPRLDNVFQERLYWLRNEVRDYWNQRKNLIEILRYLSTMGIKIDRWQVDANAARLVAGAVENDSI